MGVGSGRALRLRFPQMKCGTLGYDSCCELYLLVSLALGWLINTDAHGIILALSKASILVLLGFTPPSGQLQGFLKG